MGNKLWDFFDPTHTGGGSMGILDFDWSMHNVDTTYVIFIAGRCGSTWLTHLLEDSALCGGPHEFFNESAMKYYNESIGASSFREYFNGCVKRFSSSGKFGFQIDEYRLVDLTSLIDFKEIFPASHSIFFWMTRRNLWNQAYSFARAKATGYWHKFQDYTIGDPNPTIEISHAQIWTEILDILAREQLMAEFFKNFGIEPILIEYELMVEDPKFTITQILHNLKCPPAQVIYYLTSMESKTSKLESDGKYEVLSEFLIKYDGLLGKISQNRLTTDVPSIRAELHSTFGLIIERE